ncbi:MAG: zinc ribbon domain-containing protein [Chloroflexota bacterium]|nr:zinc ribbon domain-containing protein [Chloroflexota bacterium]
MPAFESVKTVPVRLADIAPAASEVMNYFRAQGYEVTGKPTGTGGVLISLRKGDTFKAVLGMKTSLNIEIDPAIDGTLIRAKVGIFGEQAVPTMIMLFVAWPVLLTQIWGMAQQANLDDEALFRTEQALLRAAGMPTVTEPTAAQPQAAAPGAAPYTPGPYTPPPVYPQQQPQQFQQPQQQQQAYAAQPAVQSTPAAAPVSYTYNQPAPEQQQSQQQPQQAATAGPATPQEALYTPGAPTVPTAAPAPETPPAGGETASAQASTIYCMNCGAQLPGDARFCFKCGKPISPTTTA